VHAVWADHSDPRRKYVNAINGWDGSGDAIRLDFDKNVAEYASPDHKWHDHGELHRRYVRDPKAALAVVSIYRGESKAVWIAREEDTSPQGDDMNAAEMTAWATSAAGKVALAGAAGVGVHNQRLGKGDVTIGAALQTVLARSGVDTTDEQAIITGVLAGLNADNAAAVPEAVAQRVVELFTARLQS
jgi:hypothetical protein